jgi:hypothetical protein
MTTWWIVLFVACWGTVLLLGIVVLGLIGRVQQLEAQPRPVHNSSPSRGPEIGLSLPAIPRQSSGPGIDSQGILLFLSSSCGACVRLADALRQPGASHRLRADIVTLVTDIDGEVAFADLGAAQVLVQDDGEVIRTLNVPATPYVITVSSAGTVLDAGLAPDLDTLSRLTRLLAVAELSA